MTIKPAHFPNHKVYSVCKLRDGKSSWTEIGVAFPHRDGNGFTLKLTAVPTPGGDFMLRRDTRQSQSA